jgi:hypothetical protein
MMTRGSNRCFFLSYFVFLTFLIFYYLQMERYDFLCFKLSFLFFIQTLESCILLTN